MTHEGWDVTPEVEVLIGQVKRDMEALVNGPRITREQVEAAIEQDWRESKMPNRGTPWLFRRNGSQALLNAWHKQAEIGR